MYFIVMMIHGSQRVWSPPEAIITHKTLQLPSNANKRIITENKNTNLEEDHFKKLQSNAVSNIICDYH